MIGVEEEVRILILVPPYIIPAALSQNNLRMIHHVPTIATYLVDSIVSNLLEVNYLLHFIHSSMKF